MGTRSLTRLIDRNGDCVIEFQGTLADFGAYVSKGGE